MAHNVFVATSMPQAYADRLSGCVVECHSGPGRISPGAFVAAAAGADGIISPADLAIPDAILRGSKRLRAICNIGVGYDNVDLVLAASRGIAVANTPGVLSEAVADLALGLIITLARRIPEAQAIVRDGRWGVPGVSAPPGVDLKGKVLGLVGLGRIGRELAKRAAAFGMDVIFFDSRPAVSEESARRVDSLAALLSASDFVSLHVDLNPASRNLVGTAELALMKPTAYLVNTSRGGILDQAALVAALKERRIAGAGLDVLAHEPPAPNDPILRLPNVVILPHIASNTRETRRAMVDLAIENMLALLEGRSCQNVVNRPPRP